MATIIANDLEAGVLTQPSNTRFTHAAMLTKISYVAPRPGMMTPLHGSDIGQAINLPPQTLQSLTQPAPPSTPSEVLCVPYTSG
jgi:hypothetical protein